VKVLLTSVGSSGDINPFVALGLALKQRGHEPVLLVNPYFEHTVREQGLAFEPFGEHFSPTELARETPLAFTRVLGPIVLMRQVFAPLFREMYEGIARAVDLHKPAVIVGHQISFTMPWVARDRGIPWITCALAPATILSDIDPPRLPVGTDLTKMPMWYRRFAHWAGRRFMSFLLDRPLNRLRDELSIPRADDTLFDEMLAGDAALGLWSPHFRPRAGDDPERFRVCGFPWFDRETRYGERGAGLDPALARFLDEGEAPVVFTLGSVLSHTGAKVYSAAAEACRHLGVRAVLVIGRDSSAPVEVPPGVVCVDYAPYSALLPRAAAIVHHGGIGTTAQALRAGRPTVILPHAHDQFDNAARTERLGVSVTMTRGHGSARALARSVERVLGDPGFAERARALGAKIATENGAERAAEAIEEVVRTRVSGASPRRTGAGAITGA